MNPETIRDMNEVLDVANTIIEEDAALANKTKYPATAVYTGNGSDLSDDYRMTRDTLKGLISTGQYALEKMERVLVDSDNPRNFEVVATLINSIADLSGDLIKLQRQMKDIAAPINIGTGEGDTKTKNDEFIMTTDALNKLLDNRNK